MPDDVVTLFLCGDVMLGRGVDQILEHPGDPALREPHVGDARAYVTMAEEAGGPIPRPVDVSWPWGEALDVLDEAADVRVVNLETSITTSDGFDPAKVVHYRMHPDNLGALSVARPDVTVLANNHVLDFGRAGLAETLDVLGSAGLRAAGAGRDLDEARRPAAVDLHGGGRILVFSVGTTSSGIPVVWAATEHRPGVALLSDRWRAAAADVIDRVRRWKRRGDVVVASVHWGSNWGHDIPREHTALAHALVDGGVDVVHGHSSHHPRAVEVYRDRLVVYGCGDLIDDYEGIPGHEQYRPDLRLLYLVSVDVGSGTLVGATMIPMRSERLRLERATGPDVDWLQRMLDRVSRPRGAGVDRGADGTLTCARR